MSRDLAHRAAHGHWSPKESSCSASLCRTSRKNAMDPLDEPLFSTHQHAHTQQQYWARWEYSPEEWKRFERLDWTSARHALWLLIALWLLVSVAITVGLVIVLHSMTQGLPPKDASNAFTFEVFLVGFFMV